MATPHLHACASAFVPGRLQVCVFMDCYCLPYCCTLSLITTLTLRITKHYNAFVKLLKLTTVIINNFVICEFANKLPSYVISLLKHLTALVL